MKKSKNKKPRVTSVAISQFSTATADYFWPLPYDKKERFIPSSVDCIYNAEYYNPQMVFKMIRSL